MASPYTPDGDTIERDDGTVVYPVVYLDADGLVVGKAYIPEGHEPDVPDAVDRARSATVDAGTDLATLLANSNANIPENPRHDTPETAQEKLENVVIDEKYRPSNS